MPTPALTFFFAPGSSSMAPHIALHEIGVPFEAKPISFARKETRTPEFLATNPEGKVPTLLVDGRVLTEVAGILFYLARLVPEAKLLPHGDIEAEARVISWMSFVASSVHPARSRGLEYAHAIFTLAERRLGSAEWTVGEYSIADIHLFRLFWRNQKTLQPKHAEFPNLMAHYERMLARPAVIRTLEIESALGYELP